MILGIIIGILATLFILMIIGMYQTLIKEIQRLQEGVVYLVQREYEFQKSEEEYDKKVDELNKVSLN